ncbi:MAG: 3'-5' exonuclease [Elusimicrobiota bacterium]
MIFFDLEATGLDPNTDRIVEICLLKVWPDGREEKLTERVNPGIPMPPEVIAVHGISDDDVRHSPRFHDLAPRVEKFLENADLSGYHITRFDIPLLTKELERAGLRLVLQGRRIIDAMKIFHKKESRDLASAYRFYCGKTMQNHHSAEADVLATKDILWAQLARYDDLPRDWEGLHSFCNSPDARFVDSEGRFTWRYGQAYFNFGKHKGRSLEEIARRDGDYLSWLSTSENSSDELVAIARSALEGVFPKPSVKSS